MNDPHALVNAVLLGILEGLTEFLPVSSTGHLIVAGQALGADGPSWNTFNIVIQFGAILAVVWDRRVDFLPWAKEARRLSVLVLLAFLPAAVVGLLLGHTIKQHLFNPVAVACALVAGALVILVVETIQPKGRVESLADLHWKQALAIGLAQCLALVPGTSRAMVTILMGMLLGLGRPIATEFSFLLAIPTMGAASMYELFKSRHDLVASDAPILAVGTLVSFVVALLVVRWLITYVRSHDFKPFAIWRLALGVGILCYAFGRHP